MVQSMRAWQVSSVQSLRWVWLFVTLWTAAYQASLSITNSRSLLKCPLSWWCHTTISSSVVPFSSGLQSFPSSVSFPMSQFSTSGGQSIGLSAASSNEYSGLSSSLALSFLYSPALTSSHDHWKNIDLARWTFVGRVMSLLFNILSRLVISLWKWAMPALISSFICLCEPIPVFFCEWWRSETGKNIN